MNLFCDPGVAPKPDKNGTHSRNVIVFGKIPQFFIEI